MNHADFWVMPISFASCMDEMPLRAVMSRYMAYIHLCSGICDRS